MIGYTIVGGFLGAGKTTLINAMLANATERIAVVVNDIGEINIDAALVASATEDAIELTNGCICCSIGASLASTLRDLCCADTPPDRIVVECSGAAEPARVAAYGSRQVMDEPSVVVVADATDVRRRADDRRFGSLVDAQLTAADLVAVSKSDLVGADEMPLLHAWLKGQVGVPVVVGRPADLGAVLPRREEMSALRPDLLPALRTETVAVADGTALPAIEAELNAIDGLVRAKGIVAADVGPTLVQWAAGRFETSPWSGASLPSTLVVITA